MKTSQKGSAHSIVIVLLVAGLIGALGWIFWQNVQKQNQNAADKTPSQTSHVTKPKPIELASSSSEILATISPVTFDYPKDWTLTRTITGQNPPTDGEVTTEVIKIVAPDTSVSVNYNIGIGGGAGGACLPEDGGTIQKLSYESLPRSSGVSFSTYQVKEKDGTIRNYAGLLKTRVGGKLDLATLKAGDTSCALLMRDLLAIEKPGDSSFLTGKIELAYESNPVSVYEKYSGKAYEQAKSILTSTKMTLNND